MAYADWAYYSGVFGGSAEREDIEPKLEAASDAIDALTFCRINGIGWDKLTTFQQGCVMRACCLQADFLLDNADAVETALKHYSINGVTVEFGNRALYSMEGGMAVANSARSVLAKSGLMSGMAMGREVEPCVGPGW